MADLISLNPNPSTRLLCPIAKAKIGNDEFISGDGLLIEAMVSLGEGDRSSRGEFVIYDPRQHYSQKYFKASYDQGGIVGLPPPPGAATTAGTTTAGVGNFGGGNALETERAIVAECIRQGITDRAQIAYILATAKHESGNFIYYEEIASGAAYEGRRDLGNTQRGDGVRFKGRGLVQITGRRNYQLYSQLLGQDFIANPEGMEQPNVAVFTLVDGMRNGRFTQRRLDQYVGGGRQDFRNARRVVNGLDRADLIAGYAQQYLGRIDSLMPSGASAPPAPPAIAQQQPPVEQADKGAQITIWLGYELDQLTEYTFIHTGTRFRGMAPNTLAFEGQSVRWTMNRRTKNSTYQKITLRQLAERVAKAYGLTLEMAGSGPTYEHLDQTGITDYQLLQRECDRAGFRLFDRGTKLHIEPHISGKVGFLLEYGINLDSFEVQDKARSDLQQAAGSGGTASQPAGCGTIGEAKATIEPLSGEVTQLRPENLAASGTAQAPTTTTTTTAIASPATPAASASGCTGAATPVVTPPISAGAETAQASRENFVRVKAFPGSASFTATPAALTLTPDTPFLTAGMEADFLNRVWAIETVEHRYSSSGLKTSLRFYSPLMVPAPPQATAEAGPVMASAAVPGKLQNPMPTALRGTPYDPAGRIRGRPHQGIDQAGGNSDNILAAEAGTVTFAGTKGGYGTTIEIAHSGEWQGWSTLYAHLSRMNVRNGATVQRGQVIGIEGNTGASRGNHLHFEVRRNGTRVDPEVYICPPPAGVYGQGQGTPIRSRC